MRECDRCGSDLAEGFETPTFIYEYSVPLYIVAKTRLANEKHYPAFS